MPLCVSASGIRTWGEVHHKMQVGVVSTEVQFRLRSLLEANQHTVAQVRGAGGKDVATQAPSPGSRDATSGWRWSQREAQHNLVCGDCRSSKGLELWF